MNHIPADYQEEKPEIFWTLRSSYQISYEATDGGRWSYVGSNVH